MDPAERAASPELSAEGLLIALASAGRSISFLQAFKSKSTEQQATVKAPGLKKIC